MAKTPKYMDIVEWTINQIHSGLFLPKEKFLSETALSEKFNFSRQTVRRALEVLEQEAYITRVHGSGTYISYGHSPSISQSSKRGRHINTVGVISTNLDNYIFPNIIRGIESVFSAEGYIVQLASTNHTVSGETKALELFLEKGVDALIIEPTRSALPCVNLDLYQSIMKRGIPLIFIDSFYPELPCPHVAPDDVMVGYMATNYLIDMGHENIIGLFPHSHRQGHLRYLGYVKALTERGIPVLDDNICWYSKTNIIESMFGAHLLELSRTCTAALCYNDWVAIDLMGFFRKNGKSVPNDISVMGIDNSELAKISSLTTIVHPAKLVGEAAANMIVSMINGSVVDSILFPPKLEVRGSVLNLCSPE